MFARQIYLTILYWRKLVKYVEWIFWEINIEHYVKAVVKFH